MPRREFLQQGGLADPRLTLYERDQPAMLDSGVEPFGQIQETSFALKQHHATHRRRLTGPML